MVKTNLHHRIRLGIAGLVVLLLAACAGPPRVTLFDPANDPGPRTTFFITANGWHSAVVIARADLPPGRIPEVADFPAARFIEFGWGDAVYYPSNDPSLGETLSAVMTPTPAVVHMVGLRRGPSRVFPGAEVVQLKAGPRAFAALIDYLDRSFARGGAARIASSGPGLYTDSRFYPATGEFHLFNTCNTWTARALVAAGFDIDDTAEAEALMQQVRALVKPR